MISYTSFKSETQYIMEALNRVADFYATDDTKIPNLVSVAIEVEDKTKYILTLYRSNAKGLYVMSVGLHVGKQVRAWKFKKSSHVKEILATIPRVIEASVAFLPQCHGIAIRIGSKNSKNLTRFATRLLARSHLKLKFAIHPISNLTDIQNQFIFLGRKDKPWKQIFSNKFFKKYDLESTDVKAVDAAQLDELESYYPEKPTKTDRPSRKIDLKGKLITLDDDNVPDFVNDIAFSEPEEKFKEEEKFSYSETQQLEAAKVGGNELEMKWTYYGMATIMSKSDYVGNAFYKEFNNTLVKGNGYWGGEKTLDLTNENLTVSDRVYQLKNFFDDISLTSGQSKDLKVRLIKVFETRPWLKDDNFSDANKEALDKMYDYWRDKVLYTDLGSICMYIMDGFYSYFVKGNQMGKVRVAQKLKGFTSFEDMNLETYNVPGSNNYTAYKGALTKLLNEAMLESKQMSIIKNYTGSSYSNYNEPLRDYANKILRDENVKTIEKKKFDDTDDLSYYSSDFEAINQAFDIAQPLSKHLIVYRKGRVENAADLNLKEFIFDGAILSTSLMNPPPYGSGNAVLEILIPKNSRVLYVDSISYNKGEEEVLLPPFSALKPLKIESNEDYDGQFRVTCVYMGSIRHELFDYKGGEEYRKEMDEKLAAKKKSDEEKKKIAAMNDVEKASERVKKTKAKSVDTDLLKTNQDAMVAAAAEDANLIVADGPYAKEYKNSDDQLHRNFGPAVFKKSWKSAEFYQNGQLKNFLPGGPKYVQANLIQFDTNNGYGPTSVSKSKWDKWPKIVYRSGYKDVSETQWKKDNGYYGWNKGIKKTVEHDAEGWITLKFHKKDGSLHNEIGPALVNKDGAFYYLEGKLLSYVDWFSRRVDYLKESENFLNYKKFKLTN